MLSKVTAPPKSGRTLLVAGFVYNDRIAYSRGFGVLGINRKLIYLFYPSIYIIIAIIKITTATAIAFLCSSTKCGI